MSSPAGQIVSVNPVMLPEPTLRRLPWYLAYLASLKSRNVEYVSSTQIARELNVDSSQIAKDLSFLNIRGKTRIGYEVDLLEEKLRDFLGFDRRHNAIVVGVGSLGGALMSDKGLQRYGLQIVAGLDTDPLKSGSRIHGIPVFHPDELPELLKHTEVAVAILTVPVEDAQHVANRLIEAGIRAIWNFTPRRLRVPQDKVVVTNTSFYSHLALMYNRLSTLSTHPGEEDVAE